MLYTIGHSNTLFEDFVERLDVNAIDVLIDVRSQPASSYSPQFNREALRRALPARVRYAFLGDSLGGRPADRGLYDGGGRVLYGPLSRSDRFLLGIDQLERNHGRHRMALLCSEADPLACHRFLLISRVLVERGWDPLEILHIIGDGSTRTQAELAFQGRLMEDAWTSPLSVLREPAPTTSSSA